MMSVNGNMDSKVDDFAVKQPLLVSGTDLKYGVMGIRFEIENLHV
jgi:hypothetical protein